MKLYLVDAARCLNKAILLSVVGKRMFTIRLCDHAFRVTYETRKARQDRDYLLLEKLAQDKMCILDIGANLGTTSLVMSTSLAKAGRIYAFDASEAACRIAQDNMALNGLGERVQVINVMLAECSGQALDFYWSGSSGGASLIQGYLGHDYPIRKISQSVDDFCDRYHLAPDLIKIDVEGAEGRVLSGMTRTLIQQRPLVSIELHNWREMTVVSNAAAILSFLVKIGYKMIYLRTKTVVQDPTVLADRGRCHVILLPVDTPLPETLATLDTSNL